MATKNVKRKSPRQKKKQDRNKLYRVSNEDYTLIYLQIRLISRTATSSNDRNNSCEYFKCVTFGQGLLDKGEKKREKEKRRKKDKEREPSGLGKEYITFSLFLALGS